MVKRIPEENKDCAKYFSVLFGNGRVRFPFFRNLLW